MHVYRIRKGTKGKLINQAPVPAEIVDWTTRRELSFYEFVIDPIYYHNNRGTLNMPDYITRLAERGYAVYGGENGGDHLSGYLLAVPYNAVEVL